MKKIRTRIPPSPTGMFHVGSLRTALFDYLYAKKEGGDFLLRIEDTDRERLVEGATENIVESLYWAHIPPDEGVMLDANKNITQVGEKGPYIQSERLEIYKKYSDQLLEQGHAYYCFCTKERLDELRKMQELNKQPTGYDGQCKSLSVKDIQEKRATGIPHVVRLCMPDDGVTTWNDMVRGKVSFENALIDDQVLMKTDGFPTYHLAVVVDDHLMEITHVFRGEEWLSSTPKHIVLYDMFGWEKPEYAHLSLLVNEKKQKLSKRHGDVSVFDFTKKGYLPEAMVNFVAFLGWNPGTEQEIFTLDELVAAFDFKNVHKSPAIFNYEKLDWYNKEWMKKLPVEELAVRVKSFFISDGVEAYILEDQSFFEGVVRLGRERANTLQDIVNNTQFLFVDSPSYETELLKWKKSDLSDAKQKLTQLSEFLSTVENSVWTEEGVEGSVMAWIKDHDYGVGDVLWPTRVALSGQQFSPGPFEIMSVLGKEKSLKRIGEGVNKIFS
ncbi:MAG: glutamate--tRNA ligase [Candidatus Magasanikbacteria bacterium CG_4_9_14_0_2_um_filter_41_10]|uniref:Glutamate--tRNA ligase n=1 Tax=Candidatus Magasanikbacteria bacterium CG_4_10_14_0_2_um_filter_41_31 TaxID=1974639 RepID=A0A2M7V5N3_9BACT|nr:MAG: glutamate--tRNA ligase [Candidatus Magasanikbacteria bacterium CG1_02_41_34]PIZ93914.1 MAG: glutamate--tRNA ligase [Candidatus Magasanikbacteria bacterium CG_4_10_14_0_2_um_filter_41_31]PJC53011.1 MAG: glutamate--tRNA ligase [Candidatus Magasanikbacteria bacterium CG_4_9_14_0_2_um_filter_41_10]